MKICISTEYNETAYILRAGETVVLNSPGSLEGIDVLIRAPYPQDMSEEEMLKRYYVRIERIEK